MHCCLLFLIVFHSYIQYIECFDLTLEPESNGTDVVLACIAKIKTADIFTSDQQLLRRIAYVETRDGQDSDTYSDPNNHGGIWQLSSTKYASTKTSVSVTLKQSILTKFGITWSSTSWSDLRKPLYSALAARLYLEVITPSIPLSTDTSGQANYWVNYYTTSGGTTSDFLSAATYLKNYEECEVSGLDLIFIMDASGSVGYSHFQLMKNFVRDIVNSFDIGSDSVRVGVMSYGSSYTFHFHLNTHFTKSSAISAINSLPYSGGGTDTAGAITAARSIGFTTANGARSISQGVPRIAMVITDGKSNSYSGTISAATAMHNAGIIGFAIGIAGANVAELNAIASKQQYVDYISQFDSDLLHNLQVTLSKEACEVSTEIKPNDTVNDTIPPGAVKHINFPLPDDYSGITLQVNVSAGVCTVFASTEIETPNEALHDIRLTTGGWEDTYFNQRNLSNPHAADKLYLTIKSTKAVENCTITLSIDEGDTSTEPVNVTLTPNADVSAFYGSELVAECYATGKPQPIVNWYKNGTVLATNSDGLVVTQTNHSETAVSTRLTILSLSKSHEGIFTCIGSNIIPNGTVSDSNSFSVTVTGLIAVNFTGVALSSSAIYLSWDTPVLVGIIVEHYVVECNEIATNREWSFYAVESHAHIISLYPYHYYRCRVQVVGNETYPFNTPITVLTNQAAPSAPPVINGGYSIDSRTVVIHWAPPHSADQNGIIREYRVLMTNIKTGVNKTYIFSSTTATIGSLIPSFKYRFSVVAFTVAESPISTSITITMPEDVPSGYPVYINGNSSSPNSIYISWSPPVDHEQNGVIIGYVINVTHTDTIETSQYFTTQTFIHIQGLDPYTTYVCVVAARTSVGIGPFSNLFFIRTLEDAPDSAPFHASGIALDSTSIHITWDPPLIEDHNGLIREYRVNITDPTRQYFVQLITNQTQIIVEHLKPYGVYHCYITAVTVDESPYTTAITVLTNEAAPSSPPQTLFVTVVDSKSISMIWSPPLIPYQNGMIRSYLIQVMAAVRDTAVTSDFMFSTGKTNFNTSLLHPFTTYSIQVAAVTVATGPFTMVYNITTPQDVPSSAPEGFNASALSPTSVLISWLPPKPSNVNGILQYFVLIIFEVKTGSSWMKNVTTNSIVINDLHPFYLYKLTISAVTIGEGPQTSIYIKMPESAPSAPPTNIVATNITSSAVHLSWDLVPNENQNGAVRYYQVKITETDTETELAMVSISNELMVNGLHPYYTYEVSVAAHTVDLGPYSIIESYQMDEDVPSRPPADFFGALNQNFTVDFSWISPPLSEINGILLGYELTCKAVVTQHEVVVSVLGTSYSMHRLQQAMHYTCTVCAYTVKGCGPTATIHMSTYENSPVGPPSSINVSVDTTMISLKWHSPFDHSNRILGYGVTYRMIESIFPLETPRPPITLLTNSTDTECTIESLLSSTQYSIVVFAVFDEGTGPLSETVTATTKGEDYYHCVKDYRCLSVSSDSLKCSWRNHPEEYNITELELAYRLADGFDYYPGYGVELNRIILSETVQEYTIEGLEPYAGYIIELKCIMPSYVGSGDDGVSVLKDVEFEMLSTFNTTQPILVEDTVKEFNVEILSATSIEVSWRPPQRVHWNGMILSYNLISERKSPYADHEVGRRKRETTETSVIKIAPQANHPDPSLASVPIKSEHYILTDLEENFQYHFSIGIVNSKGAGTISDPFVQVMPESVPSGPPINIQVMNSTVSSITIEWMPPNPIDANGVIVMYSLNITRPNILNIIHKQFTAQTTFYQQQGLYAYENISVSIAAMTTVGWGPYSEVQYFTTLEDEPGKPNALEAKLNDDTIGVTVNLTWKPPKRPNGVVIGYQIVYTGHQRTRISGPFVLFVNSSNHMEVLVSNLIQGYFYEFKVRGRNGYGFGANSTTTVFIPLLNASVGKSSSKISDLATIIAPAVFGVVVAFVVLLVIITAINRKRKKSKRPVQRCEATNRLATESGRNRANSAELMTAIPLNKSEIEENDYASQNNYTSVTFQASKTSTMHSLDHPNELKKESGYSKPYKSDCSL